MKVIMLILKTLAKQNYIKLRSLSFYLLAHCPGRSVIDVYPSESVLCIYNYTSTFIIYELFYNIYVIKI